MKNRPQHTRDSLVSQDWVAGGLYGALLSQAYRCHEEMTCLRDILYQAYQLFNAGRDVWQMHCDFVISSLSHLKTPIERFCVLLRDPSNFPAALSHRSYPLIVTLYQVDAQESRLTSLVSTYRSGCQRYARQMVEQKYEIHCELKKLIYYNEEALQQVGQLIDETYSLEGQRLFSDAQWQPECLYQMDKQFALVDEDREKNNIIPLYRNKRPNSQGTPVSPAHLPRLHHPERAKGCHHLCVYESETQTSSGCGGPDMSYNDSCDNLLVRGEEPPEIEQDHYLRRPTPTNPEMCLYCNYSPLDTCKYHDKDVRCCKNCGYYLCRVCLSKLDEPSKVSSNAVLRCPNGHLL